MFAVWHLKMNSPFSSLQMSPLSISCWTLTPGSCRAGPSSRALSPRPRRLRPGARAGPSGTASVRARTAAVKDAWKKMNVRSEKWMFCGIFVKCWNGLPTVAKLAKCYQNFGELLLDSIEKSRFGGEIFITQHYFSICRRSCTHCCTIPTLAPFHTCLFFLFLTWKACDQ